MPAYIFEFRKIIKNEDKLILEETIFAKNIKGAKVSSSATQPDEANIILIKDIAGRLLVEKKEGKWLAIK